MSEWNLCFANFVFYHLRWDFNNETMIIEFEYYHSKYAYIKKTNSERTALTITWINLNTLKRRIEFLTNGLKYESQSNETSIPLLTLNIEPQNERGTNKSTKALFCYWRNANHHFFQCHTFFIPRKFSTAEFDWRVETFFYQKLCVSRLSDWRYLLDNIQPWSNHVQFCLGSLLSVLAALP